MSGRASGQTRMPFSSSHARAHTSQKTLSQQINEMIARHVGVTTTPHQLGAFPGRPLSERQGGDSSAPDWPSLSGWLPLVISRGRAHRRSPIRHRSRAPYGAPRHGYEPANDFGRGDAICLAIDAPERIGLIPALLQHDVGERRYYLANGIDASHRFTRRRAATKSRRRPLGDGHAAGRR